MESRTHQEWRSRQSISWSAIWQTALFVGGILFILSGGTPWSTAGTMNAVMGRDLPLGFFTLLFLHLATAYLYVVAIAHAIYRFRLLPALLAGVGTGLLLYGINYAVFHGLAVQMYSPEARALFAHLAFSLFASGVYKGASVPKPYRGTPPRATDIRADDPEPDPVAADTREG